MSDGKVDTGVRTPSLALCLNVQVRARYVTHAVGTVTKELVDRFVVLPKFFISKLFWIFRLILLIIIIIVLIYVYLTKFRTGAWNFHKILNGMRNKCE